MMEPKAVWPDALTLAINYYLSGQLESGIGRFVEYYKHERYHESLDNLTPVDVYYGRGTNILRMRAARIPYGLFVVRHQPVEVVAVR